MKSVALLTKPETFILTHIELFNWGSFQGLHQAIIDPAGSAVIGPTGSGKTTLVDALMTLLCANPRYNLASTGGHESDRDLASYVRGISGPGDDTESQSHIARQGKTVTGIAATLKCSDQQVRLGCLLWFESTSSSTADMKKLWLFSNAPEQTLEHWLNEYHDGGMRALRQMEKKHTGIWIWPNKKQYLARLRDFFEVGENAFTLLNRAAGLKQLNSIDEIFRELVLDDHAAFDRAAEVANSFDDLTDIHQELETARIQQRSLQPVADSYEKYQIQLKQLSSKQALENILHIWFAEQAYHLWQTEVNRLTTELASSETSRVQLQTQLTAQKNRVTECQQQYLQLGGASINELKSRIGEWQQVFNKRENQLNQYQQLVTNLKLPQSDISLESLQTNQQEAQVRLEQLNNTIKTKEDEAYQKGTIVYGINEELKRLQNELNEVKHRPDSNLPAPYQIFRSSLATALEIEESDLPFVAELVQVKPEEQHWRGAIERAIGSHRLRILVSPKSAKAALRWVNQRQNRLHVRLLEVRTPQNIFTFFNDSFTHKLLWKKHRWGKAAQALLAGIDRHCVSDPELLRETPHAMTAQGLMSGKMYFYDKQDQKRLDEDWLTGFDNRDRLSFLEEHIQQQTKNLQTATQEWDAVKGEINQLRSQIVLLNSLQTIDFDNINLPEAKRMLAELNERLESLTRPESDTATALSALKVAEAQQSALEEQLQEENKRAGGLEKSFENARSVVHKAHQVAQQGMTDAQRELGATHFSIPATQPLDNLDELQSQHEGKLKQQITVIKDTLQTLREELVRKMSGAKKEDSGALSEVGTDLEDVPVYLQRLQELTKEALPEKLNRFIEYLNRSSDDGVTQLLSHIEHEVLMIEERLGELNNTMLKVDFQPERYLRLVTKKVIHESLRTLQKSIAKLNAARFLDDNGESQYKALRELVGLLRDACERQRTLGAKALLDPRFRLEFAVSVIDRNSGAVIETRTGSQGGSGGEKEIIASYVLTASLSYALCPNGSHYPLFGTIILDEAFSRSSHAVAMRIIAALREFGLHAIFITPNKEMRLLRYHTRSAIVVHRRGQSSKMASLSWEELEQYHQKKSQEQHELT